MSKIEVRINDLEDGSIETVNTDGCLILFMEGPNKVRVTGKFDLKTIGPVLAKLVMEKFIGGV